MIYYWDERDGAGYNGWWFGPKVGGDQVWAFHSDKSSLTPPTTGWRVPFDGPVDPSLVFTFTGGVSGGLGMQSHGQNQQMWAQQPQQWAQQQHLQQQPQQQQRQQQWSQQQRQQHFSQQQQKHQQMGAMRQQQMEEQKRKLEENRRKLEAMRVQRMEEQKQKMDEMRKQKEEQERKRAADAQRLQEERARQKVEYQAVSEIRKVSQRLRLVNSKTIEALKSELQEIMEKELGKCGSQKEEMQAECERALQAADERVKAQEELQRKMEETRLENEAKRKAVEELCDKRLNEFNEVINAASEVVEELQSKADKAADPSLDDLPEIEALSSDALATSEQAKEKLATCTEFFRLHGAEMRASWKQGASKEGQDEGKLTIKDLSARLGLLQRNFQTFTRKADDAKSHGVRKLHAKKQLTDKKALLQKYDKDNDGLLSQKEILAYAKGELKCALPTFDLDWIWDELVDQTGKGVPVTLFHRLNAAIGIVREKIRDAQRREKRLEREKVVSEAKVKFEKKMEDVTTLVTNVDEALKEVEASTSTLSSRAADVNSKEMVSLADGADETVAATKEKIANAREVVQGLSINDMPELTEVFQTEIRKLNSRVASFDVRLNKVVASASKVREGVARKEIKELEQLRKRALKLVRYHQGETNLNVTNLYSEFDTNKDDHVDEQEFATFFKTCKRPPSDGEEQDVSAEDLSRLFSYFDEDDQGNIPKDTFMSYITSYMKVVAETAVTDSLDIKASTTLRRLDVAEVCEVLEGPVREEATEMERLRVRLLRDGLEGWVTPVGNQGTKFLEPWESRMKVLKETIVTHAFELGDSSKTLRKLKQGEQVEMRQWMKKDDASGLTRMRVRTEDGKVGWATAIGTGGALILEAV
eukprot:TRINITY_DN4640_c0_g4_i3.p1 TRINITY_DN4640_c0_g4~~TRINITY_DN4640_c0_g4_i3.p1  ORF type:complete len:1025 (-),score=220.06 TRINITY_DN4640_c0_g4_i3:391-3012(-)